MVKIGICGHYGGNERFLDGQTVKTKILTSELINVYGRKNVTTVDTYGGAKKTLKHLWRLFKLCKECDNVIILPAHNGVCVFSPFLYYVNKFFLRRIHYIVIGGWLPKLVKKKIFLCKILKNFDDIYVETNSMKRMLENEGFNNIVTLPNCKKLNILDNKDLVYNVREPYRLCTFSRVTEKKGIVDAIDAIKAVNEKLGRTFFLLDIYGQIDPEFIKEFDKLKSDFPNYIKYKGVVDFDKSVETLKSYYALLFPTKFFTEGIPGTIIDAYSAGVPVISSKWENFSDVIDEGVVGIGYEFGNKKELVNILYNIEKNPDDLNMMKKNCLRKAYEFDVTVVSEILQHKLK